MPSRPTSAIAVAVRDMFEAAETAFGGIDVLVNNAGIMKLAKVADSDDALFDQQIAINLKGSFNAMREAAQAPARRRSHRQFLDQRRRHQARDLRRLYRDQGGGRDDDRDPVEGIARPSHHGQCGGAGPGLDRSFPRRQIAGIDRAPGEDAIRWSGSVRRRISPPSFPSSSVPTAAGSTARSLRANGGLV